MHRLSHGVDTQESAVAMPMQKDCLLAVEASVSRWLSGIDLAQPTDATGRRWLPAAYNASADLGWVDKGVVAQVVVLADECLERAKPVGVTGLAGTYVDVEVALEVG